MTFPNIHPHQQHDRGHYEGPRGSKEQFGGFVLPEDLKALGGNAAQEYPDYLGQCASLDQNLGRLVTRLKAEGLYENTVIIFPPTTAPTLKPGTGTATSTGATTTNAPATTPPSTCRWLSRAGLSGEAGR